VYHVYAWGIAWWVGLRSLGAGMSPAQYKIPHRYIYTVDLCAPALAR
jgi:hypothetical protein